MFKKAWNKWKNIAEKIGNFQATIIFSLLYFILITPVGLVTNALSDFLKLKTTPNWELMEDNWSTIDKLKLQ